MATDWFWRGGEVDLVVNDSDNKYNNNNKLFPARKNEDLTSLLLVAGSH